MSKYLESVFYSDNGSPSEELRYCGYKLIPSDNDGTLVRCGDYDQFALVCNCVTPYIRLTKVRGDRRFPCGNCQCVSTDGLFASYSDDQRDQLCPKIAWGITAIFLYHLEYLKELDDYRLNCEEKKLFDDYYADNRSSFMESHSGLRYGNLSSEQKEEMFIVDHKTNESVAWNRSTSLEKYHIIRKYAERFYLAYTSYLTAQHKDVVARLASSKFRIDVKQSFYESYLEVMINDASQINDVKSSIRKTRGVRIVDVVLSEGTEYLQVKLNPDASPLDVKKEICDNLTFLFTGVSRECELSRPEAYFKNIQERILKCLDGALATIDVCVAWFSNDILKDKLLEKQREGIRVRVIIYDDYNNRKNGVDLQLIEHIRTRAENGGVQHDKFCIIDNVTVILGSYNWSTNAEYRNSEDISIVPKNYVFASDFTKRFNDIWSKHEAKMRKKLAAKSNKDE